MADNFRVHLLRFRAEVLGPIQLPAAAGSALRSALFGALRQQFCQATSPKTCGQPPVADGCPVCFLLAPVDEQDPRGRDVPRPYALRGIGCGPLTYAAGQTLEFGLATFGRALSYFPYTVLGVEEMGRLGIGARRAGAFRLEEIWAENPLLGRQEAVYARSHGATVRGPDLPVDAVQVMEEARSLAERGARSGLRVELLSPVRLIDDGKLVKPETLSFRPFLGRLLERISALWTRYGEGAPPCNARALLHQAGAVRVTETALVWRELFRASGRHGRMLPMSGLTGAFTLEGELEPFLPWLVWGSLIQVGKDAAMGNGQFRLLPASRAPAVFRDADEKVGNSTSSSLVRGGATTAFGDAEGKG